MMSLVIGKGRIKGQKGDEANTVQGRVDYPSKLEYYEALPSTVHFSLKHDRHEIGEKNLNGLKMSSGNEA